MIELQRNIVIKAQALFYRYGIKSVSMDDVARHTAMSKKTIYEHFETKSALVRAIIEDFINSNKTILFTCSRQSANAVEEVLFQVEGSFVKLADLKYGFFYELERTFPVAWELLVKYRNRTLLPLFISNLRRGIDEGLFRKDVQLEFTAEVRLQQIATALNPAGFTQRQSTVHQLMKDFTIFYLHGITTSKGKQLLKQYLNRTHEQ